MFKQCFFVGWMLVLLPAPGLAEVGDVLLSTDHSYYPGEGEFQTTEDCVRWATRDAKNDHERALAIFKWLLTHQWHLHSPQEWCQVGRQPGANSGDYEMVVYDANRGRFSYGYGLCGTVHAWNESYWRAAGFDSRRRAFPGHTNSEVFVDGKWRMYDTDMAGIVLNRDGTVAGYDEITAELSLLDLEQNGLPKYPFAWPSDFNTMKKGWQQVAAGGNWYKLYGGGYAAQPAVVHLRSGETFTRYAHPDAFGAENKRRFWHNQKNGPNRVWTFANEGEPVHSGAEANCKGRTQYGNAVFDYRPDLKSEQFMEGASSIHGIQPSPSGLQSSDEKAAVVFEHFSPYVICGDPVDDENPMTGKATDGLVISLESSESVRIEVSPDQGQTWVNVGRISGKGQLDATDYVKGRYGWLIRLSLPKSSTLREVRFVTTCQICETIYPRLKDNGTQVNFHAKSRAVVPVLPLLVDEQATTTGFEVRGLRAKNLEFVGRSETQRLAYRVRGPKSSSVVFKIPSRSTLIGVSAAARFAVRSPTPKGARYELHYSIDQGKSWQELGSNAPPQDNEFSSGWVYGSQNTLPTNEPILVRITLFGGGYTAGLLTTELYGLRKTAASSSIEVTYRWSENGIAKSHTFRVAKGTKQQSELIPTGIHVLNESVSIRAF